MHRYIFMGILLLACITIGCKEKKPTAQGTFVIGGLVVDTSGKGIEGALVTLQGKTVRTSSSGFYTFTNPLLVGTYPVQATRAGYYDGEIEAEVNASDISFETILLKQVLVESSVSAKVVSKGTVSIAEGKTTQETMVTSPMVDKNVNGVSTLNLPKQVAVTLGGKPASKDFEVGIASFNSLELPIKNILKSSTEQKIEATVQIPMVGTAFTPINATFDKEVSITIPLDIQFPSGSILPLFRLNEETGKWVAMGEAKVSPNGTSGEAKVKKLGTYAVIPTLTFTGAPAETKLVDKVYDVGTPKPGDTVSFLFDPKVEILSLPDGLNKDYILNLITEAEGLHTQMTTLTSSKTSLIEKFLIPPAYALEALCVEQQVEKEVLLGKGTEELAHVRYAHGKRGNCNFHNQGDAKN